jgi:hypothetical protein
MLARPLIVLAMICGTIAPAFADEAKLLALGLADHEVSATELAPGAKLAAPRFNSPAVAYAEAANLKKGDVVEVTLSNGETPLLTNSETLDADQANVLLQAGKRGVPAGGWPEGTYSATIKVTRDGQTILEESSEPIPFE